MRKHQSPHGISRHKERTRKKINEPLKNKRYKKSNFSATGNNPILKEKIRCSKCNAYATSIIGGKPYCKTHNPNIK